MAIPLRIICSTWRKSSWGFGFGIWRNTELGYPLWTFALGPVCIYVRKLEKGER